MTKKKNTSEYHIKRNFLKISASKYSVRFTTTYMAGINCGTQYMGLMAHHLGTEVTQTQISYERFCKSPHSLVICKQFFFL